MGTSQQFEANVQSGTGSCTDPLAIFHSWYCQYEPQRPIISSAMCLSTVDRDNQPHSRMVLLKEITSTGFIFATNYDSGKGRQIEANPKVALLFYWGDRQVRVEGVATRTSAVVSDKIFADRPRESQIAAYASRQSQAIESRQALEDKVKMESERFTGDAVIPRPENWGGYYVEPTLFEFWQNGADRVHDRMVYKLNGSQEWTTTRLQP